MRTIKFRGWNRKNKQWLYGFYLQNRGAHFVCPDEFAYSKSWEDYEVEAETVGQFTGLHDKMGREIYEGSIVRTNEGYGPAVIEYLGGALILRWKDGGWLSLAEYDGNIEQPDLDSDEVIGNIHDNPEMLKHG